MTSAICVSALLLAHVHLLQAIVPEPLLFQEGVCTADNTIDIMEGMSLLECASRCFLNGICESVNYFPAYRTCFLRNSANFTSSVIAQKTPDICTQISVEDILFSLATLVTSVEGVLEDELANKTRGYPGLSAVLELTNDYYNFLDLASSPCVNRPCDGASECVRMPDDTYLCVTKYCTELPTKLNAVLMSNSTSRVGDKNMFACITGFTNFYGNGQIVCLDNGKWSESSMDCFPDCPAIPVNKGTLFVSSTSYRHCFNTTVHFECDQYFYNLSEPEITCTAVGEWTNFTCTPYCRQKDIPHLQNSLPKPGHLYTINDTAEYGCITNYYNTPGSTAISCHNNGTWSQPEVECLPSCSPPVPPVSGHYITDRMSGFEAVLVPTNKFTIYDIVTYSCNPGYVFLGNTTGECERNGSWTSSDAKCYLPCPDPPFVHNGNVQATSNPPYIEGDKAIISCNSGCYVYPDGATPTLTCQSSGQWTTIQLSCYRYCGDPPHVDHSEKHVHGNTIGTEVSYTCHLTFWICDGNGNSKVCNMHGQWDGAVECCFLSIG